MTTILEKLRSCADNDRVEIISADGKATSVFEVGELKKLIPETAAKCEECGAIHFCVKCHVCDWQPKGPLTFQLSESALKELPLNELREMIQSVRSDKSSLLGIARQFSIAGTLRHILKIERTLLVK